jgi:4-hydroxy-3-methylbut-2-enyl diphosphate reductase
MNQFNIHTKQEEVVSGWLPKGRKLKIGITSGASCPDTTVDEVVLTIQDLVGKEIEVSQAIAEL